MDVPLLLALWLHTVALVIAWGYYGVLGRIVLPGLEGSLETPARARALVAVETRAVPLVLVAVILFTVTGTYLLLVNPRYAGLGMVLDSPWSTLMFAKHVLVGVFAVLAVVVDRLLRRASGATDDPTVSTHLRRARLAAEAATAIGALIALLTVAAQLAA